MTESYSEFILVKRHKISKLITVFPGKPAGEYKPKA